MKEYSLLFTKLNLEDNTPNDNSSKEEKDDNEGTNNTSSQIQPPCNYTQIKFSNDKTIKSDDMSQAAAIHHQNP